MSAADTAAAAENPAPTSDEIPGLPGFSRSLITGVDLGGVTTSQWFANGFVFHINGAVIDNVDDFYALNGDVGGGTWIKEGVASYQYPEDSSTENQLPTLVEE